MYRKLLETILINEVIIKKLNGGKNLEMKLA
jgi:hypothetical protein